MGSNRENFQAVSSTARLWVALGFAVIASAAVVFNAGAVMPAVQPAPARAAELPVMAYELSASVDWTRTPLAAITPGETVGAYDR